MKFFLMLALLAFPAQAKTDCNGATVDPYFPAPPNPPCKGSNYDCNGDWVNAKNPQPPSPPCRVLAPEMSDWLAGAFLLMAGGMVLVIRHRAIGKEFV